MLCLHAMHRNGGWDWQDCQELRQIWSSTMIWMQQNIYAKTTSFECLYSINISLHSTINDASINVTKAERSKIDWSMSRCTIFAALLHNDSPVNFPQRGNKISLPFIHFVTHWICWFSFVWIHFSFESWTMSRAGRIFFS